VTANKLLEWLISRHHCTKEWPEKLKIVRGKVEAALEDMPENEKLAKILIEASRELIIQIFPMNFMRESKY
jgi:hypothetical protein